MNMTLFGYFFKTEISLCHFMNVYMKILIWPQFRDTFLKSLNVTFVNST